MSVAVWTAFAENLEQQVAKNKSVIDRHQARSAPDGSVRPDPLIESLKATNIELSKLAAQARGRIGGQIQPEAASG